MTEEKTAENENNLPTLYNSIVPLMKDIHKDLKLVNNLDFKFAANVSAVPLVLPELPMAIKHMPVIFAAEAPGILLGVLGIKQDQNLFVDENGKWAENTYIPAYIRRYPFYVARPDEKSEPVICFDEQSPFLSNDGDQPLFENGEASKMLKDLAEFSVSLQNDFESTREFGLEMEKQSLLDRQSISFKEGEEVKATVNGFKTIIREKFDALEADVMKEWMGKGWIDSVVLHLASGSNFDRLSRMDVERNGK